jgi:hypothetical protein
MEMLTNPNNILITMPRENRMLERHRWKGNITTYKK